MNVTATEQCEAAQQKPDDLWNAINGIDEITNRLDSLLSRISNTDAAKEPSCVNSSICLAELLSGGGTIIRDKVNEIHATIDRIESTLY